MKSHRLKCLNGSLDAESFERSNDPPERFGEPVESCDLLWEIHPKTALKCCGWKAVLCHPLCQIVSLKQEVPLWSRLLLRLQLRRPAKSRKNITLSNNLVILQPCDTFSSEDLTLLLPMSTSCDMRLRGDRYAAEHEWATSTKTPR